MEYNGADGNPRTTTCVIIGGQGFTGRFLVLELLRRGNWIIRIADSQPTLDVDHNVSLSDAVSNGIVSYFQVDVRDKSQLIRVADILLWKDEMQSFIYFLVMSGLFYWFILSGHTFFTSSAVLLLLTSLFLIIVNLLPFNLLQKMCVPCFELSEATMRSLLERMTSVWNKGADIVKSLAKGDDWDLFLKAAIPLYFLKLIISYSFAALVGAGLIFTFTSFFIYEQYEEEIDSIIRVFTVFANCSSSLLIACLPTHIASFFSADDELDEEKD